MNFDGAAPDFHTVPSASLGLHSIIHSCPHPHLRPDLRPPSALSSPVAFSSPVATGVPLWALCVGHPRVARRSALNRGTHCNQHRTGANRSHRRGRCGGGEWRDSAGGTAHPKAGPVADDMATDGSSDAANCYCTPHSNNRALAGAYGQRWWRAG